MHKWIASVIVGICVSASAYAIEVAKPTKDVEQALKKLAPLMTVESYFIGPGNLIGVAARYNGQPLVFFTDPEGQYMVTGAAVELATGRNLIAEAAVRHFAASISTPNPSEPAFPSPKKSAVDAKTLGELHGISQGDGATGKKAYVMFDFGCEHCLRLYESLAKLKLSGEIVWVPITYSGEVATTKAALAVGTKKMDVMALSGRRLTDAVVLNKEALGRGAIWAEANTNFAKEINVTSTPHFFFFKNGVLMEHEGYANVAGVASALGVQ